MDEHDRTPEAPAGLGPGQTEVVEHDDIRPEGYESSQKFHSEADLAAPGPAVEFEHFEPCHDSDLKGVSQHLLDRTGHRGDTAIEVETDAGQQDLRRGVEHASAWHDRSSAFYPDRAGGVLLVL